MAVQWFNVRKVALWRYPLGFLIGIAVLVAWILTHRHPWPLALIWVLFLVLNLWQWWVAYRLAREPEARELDR